MLITFFSNLINLKSIMSSYVYMWAFYPYFIIFVYLFFLAPPRLLFTYANPYIRRVDLDGLRILNLYTGGYPRAIDFDYR